MKEIFVPAVLTGLETVEPGEIRAVTLTLPEQYKVAGATYSIQDRMRPGNAFLARPPGARTGKIRRRMYTRSNSSVNEARVLETLINHTHEPKADSSIWWQGGEADALHREGGTIDVRLVVDAQQAELGLFENSPACGPANLRLEPDGEWEQMRFLGLAFSTGITPFLAHLKYMEAHDFGIAHGAAGAHVTIIVSVRNPRQLMEHDWLLDLARRFPNNVRYHPVLTREWSADWPYGKGRIIRVKDGEQGDEVIDLAPLLEVVSDPENYHLRLCGNPTTRHQLLRGLDQMGCRVLSFRSEVW